MTHTQLAWKAFKNPERPSHGWSCESLKTLPCFWCCAVLGAVSQKLPIAGSPRWIPLGWKMLQKPSRCRCWAFPSATVHVPASRLVTAVTTETSVNSSLVQFLVSIWLREQQSRVLAGSMGSVCPWEVAITDTPSESVP